MILFVVCGKLTKKVTKAAKKAKKGLISSQWLKQVSLFVCGRQRVGRFGKHDAEFSRMAFLILLFNKAAVVCEFVHICVCLRLLL